MPVEISSVEPNVDRLISGRKTIYLVGTAHISRTSADLAKRIIEEVRPDAVAVELCRSRFDAITDPERWKKTDIIKILKDGRPLLFITQLVLAAFQKKLGDRLNIKPGAEMTAAIDAAKSLNIPVVLADREVRTTLKRAWSSVSIWSIVKLFASSLWAMIKNPAIDEKEIERLKSGEALDSLLKEFAQALPDVKAPLIDERDLYLTSAIRDSEYDSIVAVVGAGHTPGIKKHFDEPIDRESLDTVPASSARGKLASFIFPAALSAAAALSLFSPAQGTPFATILLWIEYTSLGGAIGALLGFGHPLTIVCAAAVSPITMLRPFGTTGRTIALAEARVRPVRPGDKESILQSMASIRGAWRNRISRTFLIMIFTNAASTISAIWCFRAIARLLYSSF